LLGGLVVHRRQHPVPGAKHLALRLGGQQRQQCLVIAVGEVDRTSCFG
jgi:hypothetical protein